MNYKIITNEDILGRFIEWLPELKDGEKFYCCLFARNKYCRELTHIKSDKAQLKRFVSNKERLYWKIKQLEVELGAYRQKDIPVPQEALALYISPNPRNMYKAAIETMVKIAHCIRDQNTLMDVHQEALSQIQQAKSRTVYVDFDFDFDESVDVKEFINRIYEIVNIEAVTLVRTRGGLHCLVNPNRVHREFTKDFYLKLSSLGTDQVGDQLMPVPGTYQGGFTPHFIL